MNINKIVLSVVSVTLKCLAAIVIFFVLVQGGRSAYSFGKSVFVDEAMATKENAREVNITISKKDSKMDIGLMLERIGLIRDAKVFYAQAMLSENGHNMKEGSYTLNTAMTAEDIMDAIAQQSQKPKTQGE